MNYKQSMIETILMHKGALKKAEAENNIKEIIYHTSQIQDLKLRLQVWKDTFS